LKICRAKSLPIIGAGLFPSQTFCGSRGDLAPKHKVIRCRECGIEPLVAEGS
jgi:hypothetical protein